MRAMTLKNKLFPLILILTFLNSCSQKEAKKPVPVAVKKTTKIVPVSLNSKKEEAIKRIAFNDNINDLAKELNKFIHEGFTAISSTSGDLNKDHYLDYILVLKKNDEATVIHDDDSPSKRPLLILLGLADKTFTLAAKSENAVYCIDCGGMMGDPFVEVVIKNGYFTIEHYGGSAWRWTRNITFKYDAKENYWFLHKIISESFHAPDSENVATTMETKKDFGKVPFEKFDIYKED
ncbi:hypothetical protein FNW52_06855 [Flavobacterium sp. ZT3R18]|uniref:hypothetical protein n=1 Tax=Flavobacterium sp. ZT3R18 TaxID=2594429 RepID=UPI00117A3D11|nr:hypothetical protein [Flavobacterium sp. ZT3R18]TRX36952.1 hypothetical protein FNW52_06855 [Flavobacterium sp. ZT3R18]